MPREFKRSVRVAEAVKRLVAPLISEIGRELGIGMLSVTRVDISADLKKAVINVSCLTEDVDQKDLIRSLRQETTRVRQCLAANIALRFVPTVTMRYDNTIEHGSHMTRILNSLAHDPPANRSGNESGSVA